MTTHPTMKYSQCLTYLSIRYRLISLRVQKESKMSKPCYRKVSPL